MKRLIITTMTITSVLTTAVYANVTAEVTPINADLTSDVIISTTLPVEAEPEIGFVPIEMGDSNSKIISYIPKAPNGNVTVTSIDNSVGHFDSPLNIWEITYIGENDTTAVVGHIEEYDLDTFNIDDVNTDIYDVYTSLEYAYVASPNLGKVLYFPDSQVDTMTYELYQEDLINFLQPYELGTDVAVQGIKSSFALSLPEEFDLRAYNVDEYNDNYFDAISFVYQPTNKMDMPQEVFKLSVAEEQPSESAVKLLDAQEDIYIEVNTEASFSTDLDNEKFNEYVSFVTANDYENIVNHLQVPQIEDINNIVVEDIPAEDEILVVDGVITDIEYIYVADGRKVVPLRDTFEYLGYEVVWNNDTRSVDLINGANFTSVTLDEDSYYYGKMAPVSLGLAPMLIDEKTYVPVEIFTQVFPYEYEMVSNGYLSLVTE